jgi:hypothetical protein
MRWWHPAEDEPEVDRWWAPLRAVARRAEADRFPWPVLVQEHVLLGRVDRRGLASVWVYSHRQGGGLIRADERGRTYLVRGGRHVEVHVRRALWAAGLPDVTERPRRRHLRLVPSAGGEAAQVGHDPGERGRQRLHVLVGGRPADGDPEGS